MPRRASVERRAVGLVAEARLVLGDYGTRPVNDYELRQIAGVFHLECSHADLSVPAILFPPIGGRYRLVLQRGLPLAVRRYIQLHELGHVLAGEASEPMQFRFTGPLPESEDVCDLFALLGIVPTVDIEEGGEWLEGRIRELVPLEDRGWQRYRVQRLAKRLPRVREKVGELYGYY